MLLVLDIGNTNSVVAIFDDDTMVGQWRMRSCSDRTADEFAVVIGHFLSQASLSLEHIKDVYVSSVVPKLRPVIQMFSSQYLHIQAKMIGYDLLDLGAGMAVESPAEVGADRLVNAVAAYHRFGGHCIVIDFGTATTFDLVDGDGNYAGGAIAPGIHLSLHALHHAAAKLPEIDIVKPDAIIGKNTVSAMQSGMFWGYAGLIENMVSKIQVEHAQQCTIIATGGLSSLFAKELSCIDHVMEDLTIFGIKCIYNKNQNLKKNN